MTRRPEQRRPRKEIPDWARKERVSDWAWIAENMHVLWPGAQKAFKEQGRGALMIDTLTVVEHAGGSGNPMYYMAEKAVEESEQYPDALRMVRAYDPTWEMIAVLLKKGRESTYRVGVLHAKQPSVTS